MNDTHQKQTLQDFETALGIGPVAAAARLQTPYAPYKAWRNGRNKMPGVAHVAIELWLGIQE